MEFKPITKDNRALVNDFIECHWFSTTMVIRGELVDVSLMDGFTAVEQDAIIGLVTYRIKGDECEITSLDSLKENQGIGTALIDRVKEQAVKKNCNKLKLITTNDNIRAIRFCQKHGFDMSKLYYNSMGQARKLKPTIPVNGIEGILVRHEIDFEMMLQAPNQTINRKPEDILLFTDGSARGNPDGPGGYGAILVYLDSKGNEHEREYSSGYKKTTNNRMELMAAIVGLEALTKPCSVIVYSDSQYLVKAFQEHWIEGWIKKGWKRSQNDPVKNVDLWKRLLDAMEPHTVTFEWVRGHNGHPMNERCDKLATAAADGDNLLDDIVTE